MKPHICGTEQKMSVQNNLKKPEFTKTMLGYTPKEVDQYIDHILERYAAVSRDVTELKRRVTRLQLGLESSSYPSETQESTASADAPVYNGLSDSVMDKLRHMIESERRRHEEAMDALMSFLESHSRDEELPSPVPAEPVFEESPAEEASADDVLDAIDFEESDAEWENILEGFIEDVSSEEAITEEEDVDIDLIFDMPLSDKISEAAYDADEFYEEDTPAEEASEETVEEETTKEERKRTPAEIAAELDFYSDGTIHNGESYDPMTLAANSTMKRRRPTLEDFMRPFPEED